ncbi:unnamed protein product [Calypogeia fissa]
MYEDLKDITVLMAAMKPPLIVIPEVEGWQGWVVLGLVGFMLVALVAELAPPHLVMMGVLIICLALSIIDIKAAFHGFSDEAILSVAVLFVVARGIEMSGGLEYVASVLFRAPKKSKPMRLGRTPSRTEGSIVWVLLKFCVPVAIFSAFLANIPLVAMMIPPILEFGNKVNMAPSKMLMPLSYAANLGGTMTVIGASTNLVVLSMAAQKLPTMHMTLFEIGIIGLPITIAGIFYIVAFSGKLLPDRAAAQSTIVIPREYNIELSMKQTSKLAQKSIEWSGLGSQPGLNLVAITRDIETISDPTPDVVLQPKDRLHFVGVIDSVLLLAQVKGLRLPEDEGQGEVDLNQLKATQILVEAVIAAGSSMVHERIADLQCRTRFNTTIAAIHRHGKRLVSLIGEIRVEAGDCLLMVADSPDFVTKHRTNSHFSLVSQLPGFKPLNRKKAAIASVLVIGMVVASGVGMDLLMCALLSSAGLLLTRCLTPQDAIEAIELPVLIMIAAAFGIAEAMVESGAATILAKALMGLAGKSMFGLISCTYMATTLFSLAITNSAAVTIMFPVALAAANQQALDFRPFAYVLMMAASAGFMTPTACPTNLMVYSPGSYKFSDYIHYGGPLQLWLLFVTVGVTMTAKYWYIWVILILALTCAGTPLIAMHKSTHPTPKRDGAGGPDTKPGDGEHDDENPSAPLTAGGPLLAPGHDNEETIARRISQSTVPPKPSSPTSIPPTVSSPFPPRYRLEDSHSTSSSNTSSSSGITQTSRDFITASPFPPPYRLDEEAVPQFPSIRTSVSGKAAQFIYDSKPTLSDSVAASSSSSSSSYSSSEPTTGVVTVDSPAAKVPPLPAAAQRPSLLNLKTPIVPQNMPFGWHTMIAAQDPNSKLHVGPYRTRQTLLQRFSNIQVLPTPNQPAEASSAASPSSSSVGLLQPLGDNVDSFTDVTISEGYNNTSSSKNGTSGNLLLPATSPFPQTSSMSSSEGSTGSSEAAPAGLVSKFLTPRVSILGTSAERPPSTPTNDGEKYSVPAAGRGHRASNHASTYTRSPARSRNFSRSPTWKKSKLPGRGSGQNSPRKASSRAYSAASPKSASTPVEEDLTGGISNLLTTRRLSSLNDTSAFADNASVADH